MGLRLVAIDIVSQLMISLCPMYQMANQCHQHRTYAGFWIPAGWKSPKSKRTLGKAPAYPMRLLRAAPACVGLSSPGGG